MDTKRILVFAAGVAVGYFLFKQMNKPKEVVVAPAPAGEAGVNPLSVPCTEAMIQAMSTMRFSSPEGQKAFEDQFMSDCLANPSQYLSKQNV